MPKVEYTKTKGLHQKTGHGLRTTHSMIPLYSNAVEVTSTTVTAAVTTHHANPTICSNSSGCTVTLPGISTAAIGTSFWFINGADDGTILTISPNASDMFLWDVAGAAGTNDKDIVNTAATARRGDYVKITYGSADGWTILELGGTWVDES